MDILLDIILCGVMAVPISIMLGLLYMVLTANWRESRVRNKYLEKHGINLVNESVETLFSRRSTNIADGELSISAFLNEDEWKVIKNVYFDKTSNLLDFREVFVVESDFEYAKQLHQSTRHSITIRESLELLKQRDKTSTLSKNGKSELKALEKEYDDVRQHLTTWISFKNNRLVFNNEIILAEDELLETLKSKVNETRPKQLLLENTPTHPVLLEINEFLNSNELPNENVLELRQTMEEIQKKIQKEKQDAVSSHKILEAEAINTTAKQFFNIND